jgi:hypothetical protein
MLFAAFIAFLAIGAAATAVLFGRRNASAEVLMTSLPITVAAYSVVVFILNQFAGVQITLPVVLVVSAGLAVVLAATAFLLIGPPANWWSILRKSALDFRVDLGAPSARLVGGLLAAGVAMFVVTVFTSVPQEDDNYIYHLDFIRHIWQAGALPTQVSLSYHEVTNAYPPAAFIFYASTWLTLGKPALWTMQFTSLLCAVGILYLTYRLCRRFIKGNETAALLAALLLMSHHSIAYFLISTNTDTIQTFFNLAGLLFLIEYLEHQRTASLVVSMLLEAAACWVKYQGAAFIAVTGVVWVAFYIASISFLRKGQGEMTFPIAGALVWGAGITALFSPFLLRNFIRFGNPLYPALPHVFGGKDINEWTLSWLITGKQVQAYDPGPLNPFVTDLTLFAGAFLLPAAIGYAAPRAKSAFSFLLVTLLLYGFAWYRYLSPPYSGNLPRFFIAGVVIAACLTAPVITAVLFEEQEARPRLNLLVLASLVLAVGLAFAFDKFQFTNIEFVFRISTRLGALGTLSNYMLTYNKYHHFVLYVVGIAAIVALDYTRRRRDYERTGRGYRGVVASVLAATLLLYPAARAAGTVNRAIREGVSLDVVRVSCLGPAVASYIENRLPRDAKVLTFFTLRCLVPRTTVPGDAEAMREPVSGEVHGIFDTRSPQRRFYQGAPYDQYTDADVRKALTVLKREGVTHILVGDWIDTQDAFSKSPIFANVGHNPRYFKPLAWNTNSRYCFISLYDVAYPPGL